MVSSSGGYQPPSSVGSDGEISRAMLKVRLKCRYNNEIRLVHIDGSSSFSQLASRLSQDYGFDVSLKYEDPEGDLITLASQNDLNELIEGAQTPRPVRVITISVYVFDKVEAPSDTSRVLMSPTPPSSIPGPSLQPLPRRSARALNFHEDDGMAQSISRYSSSNISRLNPLSSSTASSVMFRVEKTDESRAAISKARSPDAEKRRLRWQKGEVIGQGAFGTVYLGLNLLNGELMAVKQLGSMSVSSKELASLENEIKLLRNFEHPNIVRYLGTERTDDTLSIFLEYIPGGSIRNMLDRFGSLDEAVTRLYTRQLLLGLEYLHRNGVAHRDIKGANVLVSNDGTVKVADFGASKKIYGLSQNLAQKTGTATGVKGTPLWMAPEVIRETNTAIGWKKADIWSVGCTVTEMVTGKPPWAQYSNPVTAMYHIACLEEQPSIPECLSDHGRSFLQVCFQRDPARRPDVGSLILHPFACPSRQSAALGMVRPSTSDGARRRLDSLTLNGSRKGSRRPITTIAASPAAPIGIVSPKGFQPKAKGVLEGSPQRLKQQRLIAAPSPLRPSRKAVAALSGPKPVSQHPDMDESKGDSPISPSPLICTESSIDEGMQRSKSVPSVPPLRLAERVITDPFEIVQEIMAEVTERKFDPSTSLGSDENSAEVTKTARERFEAVERHLSSALDNSDSAQKSLRAEPAPPITAEYEHCASEEEDVVTEDDMGSDQAMNSDDEDSEEKRDEGSEDGSYSDEKSNDDEVGPGPKLALDAAERMQKRAAENKSSLFSAGVRYEVPLVSNGSSIPLARTITLDESSGCGEAHDMSLKLRKKLKKQLLVNTQRVKMGEGRVHDMSPLKVKKSRRRLSAAAPSRSSTGARNPRPPEVKRPASDMGMISNTVIENDTPLNVQSAPYQFSAPARPLARDPGRKGPRNVDVQAPGEQELEAARESRSRSRAVKYSFERARSHSPDWSRASRPAASKDGRRTKAKPKSAKYRRHKKIAQSAIRMDSEGSESSVSPANRRRKASGKRLKRLRTQSARRPKAKGFPLGNLRAPAGAKGKEGRSSSTLGRYVSSPVKRSHKRTLSASTHHLGLGREKKTPSPMGRQKPRRGVSAGLLHHRGDLPAGERKDASAMPSDIHFQDYASDEEEENGYEPIDDFEPSLEDMVHPGSRMEGCPTQSITCLEMSGKQNGGGLLIAGSRDGCAYVWNVPGGSLLHKLDCKTAPNESGKIVRFTSRNRAKQTDAGSSQRARGMSPASARLCGASSDLGRIAKSPSKGRKACMVTSAGIDRTGSTIICSTSKGGVWLWDIATGTPIRYFPDAHGGKINAMLLGGSGAVGSSTSRASGQISIGRMNERRGSLNPFGERTFVTASDDRTIRVWDPRARNPVVQILKGHTDRVTSLCNLVGSGCIVSGSSDRSVRVWNARTGRQNLVLQDHLGSITCLAATPHIHSMHKERNGDFYDTSLKSSFGREMGFLSGARDGTVKFWSGSGHNLKGGKESKSKLLRTLRGHKGSVSSIIGCSHLGMNAGALGKVVTVGQDSTMRMWDYVRGRCIGQFTDPGEAALHRMARKSGYKGAMISSVVWPHEKYAFTGGIDGTIKLWNVSEMLPKHSPMQSKRARARAAGHSPTAESVHRIKAHPGTAITSICMLGDTLVSADKGGSVKTWNVKLDAE